MVASDAYWRQGDPDRDLAHARVSDWFAQRHGTPATGAGNPEEAHAPTPGGTGSPVQVRAYDRGPGVVHVGAYTRSAPA